MQIARIGVPWEAEVLWSEFHPKHPPYIWKSWGKVEENVLRKNFSLGRRGSVIRISSMPGSSTRISWYYLEETLTSDHLEVYKTSCPYIWKSTRNTWEARSEFSSQPPRTALPWGKLCLLESPWGKLGKNVFVTLYCMGKELSAYTFIRASRNIMLSGCDWSLDIVLTQE